MASWSLQSDENTRSHAHPDPKPQRRLRASQDAWRGIREEFHGQVCVACGLGDLLELHHVVPRSQSGDDTAANLVPLCRSCHTRFEAHSSGWERVAAAVRVYVLTNRPRCVYVVGKIGWDRFNARYPLLSEPEGKSPPEYRGCNGGFQERRVADVHVSVRTSSGSESDEVEVWRYRPPEDDLDFNDAIEGYEKKP